MSTPTLLSLSAQPKRNARGNAWPGARNARRAAQRGETNDEYYLVFSAIFCVTLILLLTTALSTRKTKKKQKFKFSTALNELTIH
jgi:hypothetical protein